VVTLGPVSEAEKTWLYANAALVLYPTVQEGFGLVPFEAARAGVPCLFAAQTSLAEVLPREAGRIVQWNAALTADEALRLIEDGSSLVRTIVAAGERFTWRRTGELLLEVYEKSLGAPMRPARAVLLDGAGKPDEEELAPELQRALAVVSERPRLLRSMRVGLRAARRLRKLSMARR
jgi:hypothetical protein